MTLVEISTSMMPSVAPSAFNPGGLLETIGDLFTNGTTLVKRGLQLAVLAVAGFAMAKARFATATVITSLVVSFVVIWWINDGITTGSNKIDTDLSAPAGITRTVDAPITASASEVIQVSSAAPSAA